MTEPTAETVLVEHSPAAEVPEVVDPPSANAPVLAALVCTAPTCTHRGQHVTIHTDTVLPVHCGGCFGVLHCQHEPEKRTVRAGTLGDPVEHDITECRLCRTETAPRVSRALDPAELLRSLPVGLLDTPL